MAKYVSDTQLAERFNTHRSTIWRWKDKGIIPEPVQLSPGCTRWILEEVEAREAELQAKRTTRAA